MAGIQLNVRKLQIVLQRFKALFKTAIAERVALNAERQAAQVARRRIFGKEARPRERHSRHDSGTHAKKRSTGKRGIRRLHSRPPEGLWNTESCTGLEAESPA